jgi:hypothetical protein
MLIRSGGQLASPVKHFAAISKLEKNVGKFDNLILVKVTTQLFDIM